MTCHVEIHFEKKNAEPIIIKEVIDNPFDASMFIEMTTENYRVKGYKRTWKERMLECECGELVSCDSFTNECFKCGALYNSAGQRLCDPEEWGWETGELPCECW